MGTIQTFCSKETSSCAAQSSLQSLPHASSRPAPCHGGVQVSLWAGEGGQRRSWTSCIMSPVILVLCCKGFLSTPTLQAFFKAKTLILHAVRRRNSAPCRDSVKCSLRSCKTSPWHGLQALLQKAAGLQPCTDVLESSGISDDTGCQC